MRLFIGLDLPAPMKQRLLLAMGGLAGARWQSEEQLHLTLRYLGEVDRHQAADVDAALSGISHPAVSFAVSGAGLFDSKGVPDTLWAGVTPEAPLRTLYQKVSSALQRVGIAPDERQFKPHITIARLPRRIGDVQAAVAALSDLSSPEALVQEICLYESQLSQDGSIYTILERYPLR
jgi:RNA 2',3'-cyclic 3'-phosphodiesterase